VIVNNSTNISKRHVGLVPSEQHLIEM